MVGGNWGFVFSGSAAFLFGGFLGDGLFFLSGFDRVISGSSDWPFGFLDCAVFWEWVFSGSSSSCHL